MDPQRIMALATRIRRAYQALDNCATDDADRALKELIAAAQSPAGVPPEPDSHGMGVIDHAVEVTRLTAERDHWKANHDNQVQRTALLMQRPDLPVDRLPAYREMERLQRLVAAGVPTTEPVAPIARERAAASIKRGLQQAIDHAQAPVEPVAQEPVAFLLEAADIGKELWFEFPHETKAGDKVTPLYASPISLPMP
jgi:hypothetical protein